MRTVYIVRCRLSDTGRWIEFCRTPDKNEAYDTAYLMAITAPTGAEVSINGKDVIAYDM